MASAGVLSIMVERAIIISLLSMFLCVQSLPSIFPTLARFLLPKLGSFLLV